MDRLLGDLLQLRSGPNAESASARTGAVRRLERVERAAVEQFNRGEYAGCFSALLRCAEAARRLRCGEHEVYAQYLWAEFHHRLGASRQALAAVGEAEAVVVRLRSPERRRVREYAAALVCIRGEIAAGAGRAAGEEWRVAEEERLPARLRRRLGALRVRTLLEELRWPQALAAVEGLLEEFPRSADLSLLKAECLLRGSRRDELLAFYEQLALENRDPAIAEEFCRVLFAEGRLFRLIAFCRQLSACPPGADLLLFRAYALIGDSRAADAVFQRLGHGLESADLQSAAEGLRLQGKEEEAFALLLRAADLAAAEKDGGRVLEACLQALACVGVERQSLRECERLFERTARQLPEAQLCRRYLEYLRGRGEGERAERLEERWRGLKQYASEQIRREGET